MSDEAKAQHLIEWATQIAKAAYLIGFMASGRSFERYDEWLQKQEAELSPLINQIRGESHDTQED